MSQETVELVRLLQPAPGVDVAQRFRVARAYICPISEDGAHRGVSLSPTPRGASFLAYPRPGGCFSGEPLARERPRTGQKFAPGLEEDQETGGGPGLEVDIRPRLEEDQGTGGAPVQSVVGVQL